MMELSKIFKSNSSYEFEKSTDAEWNVKNNKVSGTRNNQLEEDFATNYDIWLQK